MSLSQPSGLSAAQKRRLKQNEPTMDDVTGIPEAVATEADLSTMIEELASTDSGKGASCIGYEGGTTVQAQVAANTASIAALGGGGSTGFDAETAGAGGKMELYEATANGTNKVTMASPASLAADRTITVPDADVTLADIATNTAAIAAATTDTGVGAGNAGKLVELDGDGKLDGRNIGDDGTKLDGIEALADVTDDANVRAALAAATAAVDFNAQNITNVGTVDGRDVSADGTKLDGIEALADVTDETNVLAALAVGATAKDMGGGAISNVGLVDGRDVSTDGTKLDGIETAADVTDLANVTTALSVTAAAAVATSAGAGDAGKLAKLDAGGKWDSTMIPATAPAAHAASHTDGSDDIQDATPAQKGLMTAAYASEVTANTATLAAAASTTMGIERHIKVSTPGGVTADTDTVLPPGTWEPTRVEVINRAGGTTGDTIQVIAQGIGTITDAMDVDKSDAVITRPTTLAAGVNMVGGTNALRVTETDGAGNDSPACDVHVWLRQVA